MPVPIDGKLLAHQELNHLTHRLSQLQCTN